MKINVSFSVIALLVLLASCKKDPAFSSGTNDGNTNVPSCLITLDQNDQNTALGNQFTLTYDADGKVTRVTSANSGSPLATVDVTPTQIVRTSDDGTETFGFVKDLFAGKPGSYTYANTNNSYPARSAQLTYNGNGKPTQVKNFDAANTLTNTLDLAYDDNDNLSAVTITSAAAGSVPLTFSATSYGTKNSAFYGQPGASLMFYNWDYGNTDYTNLFTHLSRHNIAGWSLNFTGGSETAAYTYNTFNDQGYPTDVTETITNVSTGNPLTTTDIEWTYTYDCKK